MGAQIYYLAQLATLATLIRIHYLVKPLHTDAVFIVLCLPGRSSQTLLETYQVHGVVKTRTKTIFGKCSLGRACDAWAGRWMDSQL